MRLPVENKVDGGWNDIEKTIELLGMLGVVFDFNGSTTGGAAHCVKLKHANGDDLFMKLPTGLLVMSYVINLTYYDRIMCKIFNTISGNVLMTENGQKVPIPSFGSAKELEMKLKLTGVA